MYWSHAVYEENNFEFACVRPSSVFLLPPPSPLSTRQSWTPCRAPESKLSQLSPAAGNSAAPAALKANGAKSSGGGGDGGGGKVQVQVQAADTAINPATGLPCCLDRLNEKILRLDRELALAHRSIGEVAVATREEVENLLLAVENKK